MPLSEREKLLSTLGLAARAGKLVYGTDAVCDALKEGRACLVAEADGNSANTHKRLTDRCAYYKIRLIGVGVSAEKLGMSLGRRGPCAAAAVCDASLGRAVSAAAERAAGEAPAEKTEGGNG